MTESNTGISALPTALRAARKRLGWTQAKVAVEAKITRTFYERLERGKSTPSLRMLEKIAHVLGVEPGVLLGSAPTWALYALEERQSPRSQKTLRREHEGHVRFAVAGSLLVALIVRAFVLWAIAAYDDPTVQRWWDRAGPTATGPRLGKPAQMLFNDAGELVQLRSLDGSYMLKWLLCRVLRLHKYDRLCEEIERLCGDEMCHESARQYMHAVP